jgi:transcriptional regulator with XRE-family HTH domain
MTVNPLARTIRAKKLGLLIYDARLAARRNVEECAKAIGVSPETFEAYEKGLRSPSLPELELLAYYLNVPLDHFWSNVSRSENNPDRQVANADRLISLRQKMIGATLRQLRSTANLSPKEMHEQTGITEADLTTYELGERAIPLADLEIMIATLGSHIDTFIDKRGPVGSWMTQQQAIQKFLELPVDMQNFVSKPLNRPYVALALRLSELSTEKLRAVAEGLLEITY